MSSITEKQARDYLERRRLLGQREIEELRKTSMETRLLQLDTLVASRHLFASDPMREREVSELRERWARIRQSLDE